jgi:hypothetical protein
MRSEEVEKECREEKEKMKVGKGDMGVLVIVERREGRERVDIRRCEEEKREMEGV